MSRADHLTILAGLAVRDTCVRKVLRAECAESGVRDEDLVAELHPPSPRRACPIQRSISPLTRPSAVRGFRGRPADACSSGTTRGAGCDERNPRPLRHQHCVPPAPTGKGWEEPTAGGRRRRRSVSPRTVPDRRLPSPPLAGARCAHPHPHPRPHSPLAEPHAEKQHAGTPTRQRAFGPARRGERLREMGAASEEQLRRAQSPARARAETDRRQTDGGRHTGRRPRPCQRATRGRP